MPQSCIPLSTTSHSANTIWASTHTSAIFIDTMDCLRSSFALLAKHCFLPHLPIPTSLQPHATKLDIASSAKYSSPHSMRSRREISSQSLINNILGQCCRDFYKAESCHCCCFFTSTFPLHRPVHCWPVFAITLS